MSETPRLFIKKDDIDLESGLISISDKSVLHHISKVLRIKLNDDIIILDGLGKEILTGVESISKNLITLKILSISDIKPFPSFSLNLIQAVVKGDKQDFIIQKATEIGVSSVINLISDYSNVQLSDDNAVSKKIERWQKVALSASMQSKRANIPDVSLCSNLLNLFESGKINFKNDTVIACVENDSLITIKQYLKQFQYKTNTYVLIGPEGGWSANEIDLFNKYNVNQVSLGSNILRSDTASIIALGIIVYELEL
ncbi:MAG: 16S rRNA (uracil(1498)-N(3))-methyltransferase [Vampirovibrionia bacterium]